jgi:CRP-like cAMP-binding protein
MDCHECPVRGSALFCVLESADLSHIQQPIEHVLLDAHSVLYHRGDHRRALFTLRSGVIKLVQYLPDGSQRIVRLLGGSDLLGLEALVQEPYQHHAIALEASEVCVIPVALVEHLSRSQPRLCKELMRRWNEALEQADYWLTQFSTGTSRQRIARLLLSLVGSESDGPIHLFGREDIGAMLGLSTETASRAIAELRRRGILFEIRPNVFQCKNAALRRIADGE